MTDAIRMALDPCNIPVSVDLYSLTAVGEGSWCGRKGDSSFVLVGPGQADEISAANANARFTPWTSLQSVGVEETLRDRCVLEVSLEEDLRDAIGTIFAGLLATSGEVSSSLGSSIRSLMPLFETRLAATVPATVEVGLLGELITILLSPDSPSLFSHWHSAADSRFDFSTLSERLDVKTTLSDDREHFFTSRQMEFIPGVCTTFLSLRLREVAIGTSVATAWRDLSARLSPPQAQRLTAMIIETTGSVPELVRTLQVDLAPVPLEMWHLDRLDIPTPIPREGVLSMEWKARLSPGRAPIDCALSGLLPMA